MIFDGYDESNMTIDSTDENKTYDNGKLLWSRYGDQYNFTGKSLARGEFEGAWTYYWELTSIAPNETITINYHINGTGDYKSIDIFIIGVDPMKTQRIASSKKIISADGIKLPVKSKERLPIGITFTIFILSIYTLKKILKNRCC